MGITSTNWMSAAIAHRELLIGDLAEEITILLHARRTDDDPLLSLVERTLDDAEGFLSEACDWLPGAPPAVAQMALRLSDRVSEIRRLLDAKGRGPVRADVALLDCQPADAPFADRWC